MSKSKRRSRLRQQLKLLEGVKSAVQSSSSSDSNHSHMSDIVIPIDQKFSWSSSNINERVKGRKPRISVTDASDHDDTRLHLDIESAAKCNTSSSSSSTTTSRSGSITDPGGDRKVSNT